MARTVRSDNFMSGLTAVWFGQDDNTTWKQHAGSGDSQYPYTTTQTAGGIQTGGSINWNGHTVYGFQAVTAPHHGGVCISITSGAPSASGLASKGTVVLLIGNWDTNAVTYVLAQFFGGAVKFKVTSSTTVTFDTLTGVGVTITAPSSGDNAIFVGVWDDSSAANTKVFYGHAASGAAITVADTGITGTIQTNLGGKNLSDFFDDGGGSAKAPANSVGAYFFNNVQLSLAQAQSIADDPIGTTFTGAVVTGGGSYSQRRRQS